MTDSGSSSTSSLSSSSMSKPSASTSASVYCVTLSSPRSVKSSTNAVTTSPTLYASFMLSISASMYSGTTSPACTPYAASCSADRPADGTLASSRSRNAFSSLPPTETVMNAPKSSTRVTVPLTNSLSGSGRSNVGSASSSASSNSFTSAIVIAASSRIWNGYSKSATTSAYTNSWPSAGSSSLESSGPSSAYMSPASFSDRMVSAILPAAASTDSTRTLTASPTETVSAMFLTTLFAS
mmetsp:Transcript_26691/g.79285  ORF Transcript_26691/g.79285 Transcript_26691/m.79285 type:complete len:239 (+) Transcript_26691:699-1415(+)